MSIDEERKTAVQTVEDDDEPDDWDKRIFSTGCSQENAKMTDCYFEKKDWRACKSEVSCRNAENQTPTERFSAADRTNNTAYPVQDLIIEC
ncbi:hypothetical protein H2201_007141 [Coniosporium apollinis]|uniref:Uncharacterized protein n=1 Tax=Coniosporium apollinis TaxID=61459 RepID=A0ABQ9NMC6_9PEZI|nr:hypothetical protein H2201_007141 [Coniosporium apollinis]